MNNIRNFCIIAHIDHGKSTLADRFLEITHTVAKRDMRAQLLDGMDLERERGITIKLQPVRMEYQTFILNLIDTPGHVDFSYEVSRSLQAVEGAILLVDASQGVEAQTLANLYLAMEQNLVIIPVINKIDLPNADVPKVKQEVIKLLGVKEEEILLASGKTGAGVDDILQTVIAKVPSPAGSVENKLQALIFDSTYDDYRGVVVFVRVMNGSVKKGDIIYLLGVDKETHALEVGTFKPKFNPREKLEAGEIGYIVTGFKEVAQARVGDTVTHKKNIPARGLNPGLALPGYRQVKPMVFAGFFPETGEEYPKLRDAIGQIKLSDAALSFEAEHSPALGFGYRCGFLGMLHMEIIAERIKREHGVSVVITTPSVAYQIHLNSPSFTKEGAGGWSASEVPPPNPLLSTGGGTEEKKGVLTIHSPLELPDPSKIAEIREPWAKVEIVTPSQYIGSIMSLAQTKHGLFGHTEYLEETRVILHFEIPLAGLVTDFYDKLKSVSSGYASMNYEILDFRKADVVKLDIIVAEEIIEAFSIMVNKQDAYDVGKATVEKLKELIPKQQFVIKLQAAVGAKIIASERIGALHKDVTKGLYGGDVTRKMKLLKKQKAGKKKMMATGKVNIPSKAFLEVLKR